MIRRLHLPLLEPEDVVRHLGYQEKHWKAGRSAHALVQSWYATNALPASVQSILATQPRLRSAQLIDAFLERQVDLGTAGRPSQTDLSAIVGLEGQIAVVAVEAKAGEPFGQRVREWNDGSDGKRRRLRALCSTLGLTEEKAAPLRYQLLHRTAAAVYEARRYRTDLAVMLVQSFAKDEKSFVDFSEFLRAAGFEGEIARGVLTGAPVFEGVTLYAGWIDDADSVDADHARYLNHLRRYADGLSRYSDRLREWCDR